MTPGPHRPHDPGDGFDDADDFHDEWDEVEDRDRGFDAQGHDRFDDGSESAEPQDDESDDDPDLSTVARGSRDASIEIASATADLDDEGGVLDAPVPDAPPLTLGVVESLLDRRRNEVQVSPTLARITALLDVLGNPQRAYPVIEIAGTNGKTSTARMIDALITRIGPRTGRFTSPHLQLVTERIAVDNAPISVEQYVRTYADVAPYVDLVDAASERDGGLPLSKFEILTAMAFSAFADAPVDVAVVEAGLGGTWDSTNVADATVGVITPIGLDHVEFLGDTLTEIAGNKAGIIKPDTIAIIGPQQPEAMTVLLRRAVDQDATVARFGSEFSVLDRAFAVGGQRLTLQGLGGVYEDVFLPLSGEHQAANAAQALAAVEAFFGAGASRQLDIAAVQDGFAAVAAPGRLERVRASPAILVDAAHNPHGAAALAATLAAEFSFTKLVGVLAVMADKDVRGVVSALADSFDEIVVTRNSSPRSMPPDDLAEIVAEIVGHDKVYTAARMDEAIALAVDLAEADPESAAGSGVVITGSVVSAGDGRALAGLTPA